MQKATVFVDAKYYVMVTESDPAIERGVEKCSFFEEWRMLLKWPMGSKDETKVTDSEKAPPELNWLTDT